jgi:hypothetical protein
MEWSATGIPVQAGGWGAVTRDLLFDPENGEHYTGELSGIPGTPARSDKLDVQEIIGSLQVSEAHRIDALSHNIREVLQDGRQFQCGRGFVHPQPMTRDEGNIQ